MNLSSSASAGGSSRNNSTTTTTTQNFKIYRPSNDLGRWIFHKNYNWTRGGGPRRLPLSNSFSGHFESLSLSPSKSSSASASFENSYSNFYKFRPKSRFYTSPNFVTSFGLSNFNQISSSSHSKERFYFVVRRNSIPLNNEEHCSDDRKQILCKSQSNSPSSSSSLQQTIPRFINVNNCCLVPRSYSYDASSVQYDDENSSKQKFQVISLLWE